MLYQLILPGPIEGVDSFSVLEWSVREGDLFEAGSLIVELEAEKAIIQLRAARAGSLRKILCPAGDWRVPGDRIALITDNADEDIGDEIPALLETFELEFDVG